MSYSYIALVPRRYHIPAEEREALIRRMVGWMQERGWIEREKSHCVLGPDDEGWRITAEGAEHIAHEEPGGESYGLSVSQSDDKQVTVSPEGELAVRCPKCGEEFVDEFMEMVGEWSEAEGYPLMPCPFCGEPSEIRDYENDMAWGFSNLVFELHRVGRHGELDEDFVEELAGERGEPVEIVWVWL